MVGWKDILRPIRDGLRDQLPPRNSPEDPAEEQKRRRQRESDSLKGFAYFDSFEQVEDWRPDEVESWQRANAPLIRRPPFLQGNDNDKARVILIHDYAGNYHKYEDCRGVLVKREGFAIEYMQFIDTFVYFSHKLVCIPPPTWTNSLHHNGVRSLGTFLVEPQSTGIGKILERVASKESESGWDYVMATRLAEMARLYGFDGWLLNIEKTFPYTQWDYEKMLGFIGQLSSQLGRESIIWYDALTTSNTLQYQNSLTMKNLPFAKAAGTLLTNYAWTPEKLAATRDLCMSQDIEPQNIVFGIDVWAQNTQDREHPRNTYGGGGTGTGIAVARLAESGFSAGIFAPAWPFEHFPTCSAAVQKSMWEGTKLPDVLGCRCVPESRHAIEGYRANPVLKFAAENVAGSASFFYTNFERPFIPTEENGWITANVGSQSVLPLSLAKQGHTKCSLLSSTLASNPSRLAIVLESNRPGRMNAETLMLFKLQMTGYLEVTVVYRKGRTPKHMRLRVGLTGTGETIDLPAEAYQHARARKLLDCTQLSNRGRPSTRLTGICLRVEDNAVAESPSVSPAGVVDVLSICIRRRGMIYRPCSIVNLALVTHTKRLSKLTWDYESRQDGDDATQKELPWSDVTGPISHFLISIDHELVGQARTTGYLLSAELTGQLNGSKDVTVSLDGIGHDGSHVCTYACTSEELQEKAESGSGSWQMVQRSEISADVTAQSGRK